MKVKLKCPPEATVGTAFVAKVVISDGTPHAPCDVLLQRSRPVPKKELGQEPVTLSPTGRATANFDVILSSAGVNVLLASAETDEAYDDDGESVVVT